MNVPNWRAPHALSAETKAGRSSLPGLPFLADPKSDDIHGPMQGGRDKDDGNETEERVTGEEARDGPVVNRQAHEQRTGDEIVLVEGGGFRAARLVHPPLEERAREVSEERREREDAGEGEPESLRDRLQGHRGRRTVVTRI